MRFALILALLLGACAAKKPAVKQPENTEKKSDLDKDKDEKNNDVRDDKDDAHDKRTGDPCEGGE